MPWKDLRAMSQKLEIVEKASASKANVAALFREYGISRQTRSHVDPALRHHPGEHERVDLPVVGVAVTVRSGRPAEDEVADDVPDDRVVHC